MKRKSFVKLAILMFAVALMLTGCTEGCSRWQKDMDSNWNGGLERTVYVYDLTNTICVRAYHGTFDVETDRENYVLFDMKSERHMIYYSTANIYIDEETYQVMESRIEQIESQQEIKVDVFS